MAAPKSLFGRHWLSKAPAPEPTRELAATDKPAATDKHASYPMGDFRIFPEQAIHEMRGNMRLEQLHNEQVRRLWYADGPSQGVVLKQGRGQYAACPPRLQAEAAGLYDQIIAMNVPCAMTVRTPTIKLFLSIQLAEQASLRNGLAIQILAGWQDLARALKHQCAAFVRSQECLVIWDDEPDHLIRRVAELESQILTTVWTGAEPDALDEKKGDATVTVAPTSAAERGPDLEAQPPETRPIVLWSPAMVAGTLVLIMSALGLGLRALAMETAVDGSYIRWALCATLPLLFFMGLFMMQTVVGCAMQMLGPVSQMMHNSRAYSGQPPPRIQAGALPHITIQMPVYKEGLGAVIRPTVLSLKAAISTYELQGGTANIFVNDDGMQLLAEDAARERADFYAEHSIGWVARPKHNPPAQRSEQGGGDASTTFTRRGKFKKASNMNFALMVSNSVEDRLRCVPRSPAWTQRDEEAAYETGLAETLAGLGGKAWAAGNIRVGDYVLLIDSDTRVPRDCLLDAASEMEASPEVAILQYSSGVMQVTDTFFENAITFFTNLVYTAIRFAVASGDVCPFVGHNAVLRWAAVQQVAYQDADGYEKFWSEAHVSEDFDMALRLQCAGYSIRLGAYHGDGFREGVSLTVYDELARWEKYAYGCNELLFHPLRLWLARGPFTPLFRRFLGSRMPVGAKLTIVAYIGTYYAIGAAWLLTLLNYFLAGWYAGYVDKFYIGSFQVYVAIVVVFSGLGNVALAILRYRTAEKALLPSLWENFRWVLLLTIFLGGISLHVSQALLAHMFEIDMSWGATSKEVERITFFEELPRLLRRFKFTFVFCVAMIGLMIAGAHLFPVFWRITTFNAIYPLCTIVFSHLLLPIALNPALMLFSW
ncbi:hypothetical protein B2J93_4637 [Marssonina coronariae]|uniref:Uncharacterized protein n=1 Tax=Diplocarpon coronariae TaxID=2795749 RepID=A0A218YUT2_9HELO|nr:hypothetical protein B2J93_4637 [Marssonina coronariae]